MVRLHTVSLRQLSRALFLFSNSSSSFCFLLTVSCLEFYRKRELTLRLLGYMLFLWCLFAWGKNSYIVHYGVHVIGHYLEKPSYTTKYYVEIRNDDTNRIIKAIADISVGSRFEEHMSMKITTEMKLG